MVLLKYYQAACLALLVLIIMGSAGCILPGAALKRYLPQELAPDGLSKEIRLLVWNLAKGDYGELEALADTLQPTLLCLQEVPDPRGRMASYCAAFAANLELNGHSYGLALFSEGEPRMVRRLFSDGCEPVARTRKQVLACRYGSGEDAILVLNVHALNLTRIGSYEQQLFSLEPLLDAHPGPVVLCGDFNTWSGRREQTLKRWTAGYRLEPVDFGAGTERIRRFLRSSPFDRVFIRGLAVREGSATVLDDAGGSDHRPLFVVLERLPAAQTISASSASGGVGVAPAWVATQAP